MEATASLRLCSAQSIGSGEPQDAIGAPCLEDVFVLAETASIGLDPLPKDHALGLKVAGRHGLCVAGGERIPAGLPKDLDDAGGADPELAGETPKRVTRGPTPAKPRVAREVGEVRKRHGQ